MDTPKLPLPQTDQQIVLSSTPVPLTVQYLPRTVMVHPVTTNELDAVASLSNSLNLTFFGISFGSTTAFGIVLSTSVIGDPKVYAAYVALLAVSFIGSGYFGIRGILDYRAAKKKLEEIKSGRQ
jgi:hypothetical protein